jgi:hypothetical protein
LQTPAAVLSVQYWPGGQTVSDVPQPQWPKQPAVCALQSLPAQLHGPVPGELQADPSPAVRHPGPLLHGPPQ